MRRILVERARMRRSVKRGSGQKVSLDEAAEASNARAIDLIALDDALTNLSAIDTRKSQVVELKYFGGLTIQETADVLGISTPTVEREWQTAKIWLFREISQGDG
jgi:RNA polymerase sigma factor (TIGR02999 family)